MARRSRSQRKKRRAWMVGAGALAGHLCLALIVPLLLVPSTREAARGVSVVVSVVLWLVTMFFVYYGASRLAVPTLPFWAPQFEHWQASGGVHVVIHTGSKEPVINRRRAAVTLAVGLPSHKSAAPASAHGSGSTGGAAFFFPRP